MEHRNTASRKRNLTSYLIPSSNVTCKSYLFILLRIIYVHLCSLYNCLISFFSSPLTSPPKKKLATPQPKYEVVQIVAITYEDGSFYYGEGKNGGKHGKGVLTSVKQKFVLRGQWDNDNLVEGELDDTDSRVLYDGEFRNNMKHGQGTEEKYDIDKSSLKKIVRFRYSGQWQNDKKHGYGRQTNEGNGFIYSGQWEKGLKHGRFKIIMGEEFTIKGVMNKDEIIRGSYIDSKADASYEGEFENLQFHGYGVHKYKDKSTGNPHVYEGHFKRQKKHGHGKLTDTVTQTVLEGTFDDDKFVAGRSTYIAGDYIEGQFALIKSGPVGYVTYVSKVGDKYEGEMMAGVFCGPCKVTYSNGDVYEGCIDSVMLPDGWGTLRKPSHLNAVTCRWSHDKVHIDDIMMRIMRNVKAYAGSRYSAF